MVNDAAHFQEQGSERTSAPVHPKDRMTDDLYFIRVKDGPVKIGRTGDVKTRLACFQVACPYELELVGIVSDGGHYETTFHFKLEAHRMRGEWFAWTDEVAGMIEAALDSEKWVSVLGFQPLKAEAWWEGSPLYADRARG